ncbi:MAG: hypothetical protein ABOK23_01510 [Candidatus Methanoperedens sp.]|nr:hypothetical protein [Candidatus Methanoperedens sp.]MCZ7394581.1 hypothetical protein [Candidatus Methanoperedens sp.]
MKIVFILLVLILAASVLGCVSPKSPEVTPTATPVETPAQTPVSPTETPVSAVATPTPSGSDDFGTQNDINAIDSLVNDSNMDIPLSDATI